VTEHMFKDIYMLAFINECNHVNDIFS